MNRRKASKLLKRRIASKVVPEIEMTRESTQISSIPTLSRNKHEAWFRRMKSRLEGKGIFYTAQQTIEEYACIKRNPISGENEVPKFKNRDKDEIDNLTSKFERLGGSINIDRENQFNQDQSKLLSILTDHLTEDDQIIVDECGTAKGVWSELKKKYGKINITTANSAINSIQRFRFEEDVGIEASWDLLRNFRRKLITANSRMQNKYPDEALLSILMNSLPDNFQTTVDSLHLRDELTPEEKLDRLVQKEERSKEKANIASRSHKMKSIQRRRGSDVSMKDHSPSERSVSPQGKCYLCKGNHYQRFCPYVLEIQDFAKLRSKSSTNNRRHGYSARKDSDSTSSLEKSDYLTSSDDNSDYSSWKNRERVHLSKELI